MSSTISPATYFAGYFIIVIVIFFLIYWIARYTINELEAISIALVAGAIYLAALYRYVTPEPSCNVINFASEALLWQFTVWVIISFTILFVILTGIGLFTFAKSCTDKPYYYKY